MARSFVLSDLVTRCQEAVDMVNSQFMSSSEWKRHISTYHAELHEIHTRSGHSYFESVQTINATGSTTDYALDATYRATVGVAYQVEPDNLVPLDPVMPADQEKYQRMTWAGRARGYRIVGGNVRLLPKPPAGQTYIHRYVPQPADLSSAADATSVDVISPTGERFIVTGVAIHALQKEESDVTAAMAAHQAARDELMAEAQNRLIADMFYPTIQDEDDEPGGYGRRWW